MSLLLASLVVMQRCYSKAVVSLSNDASSPTKTSNNDTPILIDAEGSVIAGHGRLEAAKRA